ncbi:proline-rich protein 29 [Ornithorhynchus anatinus]|uniref:proline-rich protein 29 n=1 Tax=Ornithorhynchus anatinus TaxID=9258 RepID=UPI0019D4C00A|nr:proline-rich protein 29 [Ornithorhynchus anatinus]
MQTLPTAGTDTGSRPLKEGLLELMAMLNMQANQVFTSHLAAWALSPPNLYPFQVSSLVLLERTPEEEEEEEEGEEEEQEEEWEEEEEDYAERGALVFHHLYLACPWLAPVSLHLWMGPLRPGPPETPTIRHLPPDSPLPSPTRSPNL